MNIFPMALHLKRFHHIQRTLF